MVKLIAKRFTDLMMVVIVVIVEVHVVVVVIIVVQGCYYCCCSISIIINVVVVNWVINEIRGKSLMVFNICLRQPSCYIVNDISLSCSGYCCWSSGLMENLSDSIVQMKFKIEKEKKKKRNNITL